MKKRKLLAVTLLSTILLNSAVPLVVADTSLRNNTSSTDQPTTADTDTDDESETAKKDKKSKETASQHDTQKDLSHHTITQPPLQMILSRPIRHHLKLLTNQIKTKTTPSNQTAVINPPHLPKTSRLKKSHKTKMADLPHHLISKKIRHLIKHQKNQLIKPLKKDQKNQLKKPQSQIVTLQNPSNLL
ncbi:immunogenic secreted protein [Streptococcus pyogenes]|nr:immunogenic secreted protein [Streptococcus pyogenes]